MRRFVNPFYIFRSLFFLRFVMLNESEKKVLDIIEGYEKDIVSLMQKLTQIPSVTGEEAEIGEFVFNEVKKFGLDSVEIVEEMLFRF